MKKGTHQAKQPQKNAKMPVEDKDEESEDDFLLLKKSNNNNTPAATTNNPKKRKLDDLVDDQDAEQFDDEDNEGNDVGGEGDQGENSRSEENSTDREARRQKRRENLVILKEMNSRTVFVGRLPRSARQDDVKALFEECGSIDDTGKLTGAGFVRFVDPSSVEKALLKNGVSFKGANITVNKSEQKPAREHQGKKSKFNDVTTLYIGNIPFEVTTQALLKRFKHCGTVMRIDIPKLKATGKSRGFAMIQFQDPAAVEKALQLDGSDISGRKIKVRTVEKKDQHQDKKKKKTGSWEKSKKPKLSVPDDDQTEFGNPRKVEEEGNYSSFACCGLITEKFSSKEQAQLEVRLCPRTTPTLARRRAAKDKPQVLDASSEEKKRKKRKRKKRKKMKQITKKLPPASKSAHAKFFYKLVGNQEATIAPPFDFASKRACSGFEIPAAVLNDFSGVWEEEAFFYLELSASNNDGRITSTEESDKKEPSKSPSVGVPIQPATCASNATAIERRMIEAFWAAALLMKPTVAALDATATEGTYRDNLHAFLVGHLRPLIPEARWGAELRIAFFQIFVLADDVWKTKLPNLHNVYAQEQLALQRLLTLQKKEDERLARQEELAAQKKKEDEQSLESQVLGTKRKHDDADDDEDDLPMAKQPKLAHESQVGFKGTNASESMELEGDVPVVAESYGESTLQAVKATQAVTGGSVPVAQSSAESTSHQNVPNAADELLIQMGERSQAAVKATQTVTESSVPVVAESSVESALLKAVADKATQTVAVGVVQTSQTVAAVDQNEKDSVPTFMDGAFTSPTDSNYATVIFEYKVEIPATNRNRRVEAKMQASFYAINSLLYRAFKMKAVHNIIAFVCFGRLVEVYHYQIDLKKNLQYRIMTRFDLSEDAHLLQYFCFLTHLPGFIRTELAKQPNNNNNNNNDNDDEDNPQPSQPGDKAQTDTTPEANRQPDNKPKSDSGNPDQEAPEASGPHSAPMQNLLFKPFFHLPPLGKIGSLGGKGKVCVADFNKDLVEWGHPTWEYTTKTKSGGDIIVRKTEERYARLLYNLQGKFGVPELIAFFSASEYNSAYVYYATEIYAKNPVTLSLESKVRQLLLALRTIHDEYVENCNINIETVQWKGDEIKLTKWKYCHTRYDMFNEFDPIPVNDLSGAGKVIQEWCKTASKSDRAKFNRLAEALMNPCAYRKISLEAALRSIDDARVLDLYFEKYSDSNVAEMNFEEKLKCSSERELIVAMCMRLEELLDGAPNMTHQEALDHLGITNVKVSKVFPHVHYGRFNEIQVVVKTLSLDIMHSNLTREFCVSQLLSDVSDQFPELLKYHVYTSTEHPSAKFNIMMVFTRYCKQPPPEAKDIVKFSAQLLSAIAIMHECHLVHSDVAPQNIVWDGAGDVVLIDFGSTYFANVLGNDVDVDCVPHGHPGFAPEDPHRLFATDVYSAGKTIAFFGKKWCQRNEKINALVQLMTCVDWAARISIKEAVKTVEECKLSG